MSKQQRAALSACWGDYAVALNECALTAKPNKTALFIDFDEKLLILKRSFSLQKLSTGYPRTTDLIARIIARSLNNDDKYKNINLRH